tara:strand:+ start:15468 stop:16094 length:627 start_codon:yes stop_codon:yes gene_type:complete
MDYKDKFLDQNINITVPVVIGYQVLTRYIGGKLVGEILSNDNKEGEKSNYAMVLDVSIEKSNLEGFDLLLNITLKTLTNLFKNREIKILFHAALELDKDLQHVSLKDFEIDGKTTNRIADKLLETITNKWMYKKLKKKMFFDLMPLIEEKVAAINLELENKLEAKDGVHLIGSLNTVKICNISAGEKELWISILVLGTGLLEIVKLEL